MLHSGRSKPNQRAHHAVVNIDTGERDLQQCADAAIRLYSEYLWSRARQDEITFRITNGMWVPWSRWERGERLHLVQGERRWTRGGVRGRSRSLFRHYLRFVMGYAGTASLARHQPRRALPDLAIGDVLVQGGFPGHAVVVLDMAQSASGEKLVLLGQSYMPAQDFHVLRNSEEPGLSPWFRVGDLAAPWGLRTPEWRAFRQDDLRAMSP